MAHVWAAWDYLREEILSQTSNIDGSGLYRIRVVNDSEVPLPIPRLGKPDNRGILYIGSAGVLKTRLTGFRNSNYHSGSETLLLVWNRLRRRFGHIDLQFQVKQASEDIRLEEEKREIQNYFFEFCEVPPCNSNIPGKKSLLSKPSLKSFKLPDLWLP